MYIDPVSIIGEAFGNVGAYDACVRESVCVYILSVYAEFRTLFNSIDAVISFAVLAVAARYPPRDNLSMV